MITNLSHPDNKKANDLAQYQRVAAVWANDLSRGAITRSKVDSLINGYSTEAQAVLKQWLNTYRTAIKKRLSATTHKPRTVPHWVRR